MGAVQSRRRSSAATDRGAVDLVSSSAAAELPLRVAEPQLDDSISEVYPKLYIGQQSAALNLSLVRKLGIRAFVNCSNRAAPEFLGQERYLSCLAVPVHDDPKEAISQHFERAAQWARTKDGLALLVFCMSGISRSATIVLVLLMKNRGMTLAAAHARLRECRPKVRPNKGFAMQLLQYELKLRGCCSMRRSGNRLVPLDAPAHRELGKSAKTKMGLPGRRSATPPREAPARLPGGTPVP